MESLAKHRVQVAVHMDLDTMLTQLAINGFGTASVDLAPKWQAGVQNGTQGVVAVCQEGRAAPTSPTGSGALNESSDCWDSHSRCRKSHSCWIVIACVNC